MPLYKKYKKTIKIASAHIHITKNNPAKFHDNPMGIVGRTYTCTQIWTDGRKDKCDLVLAASLKWRGIKCT